MRVQFKIGLKDVDQVEIPKKFKVASLRTSIEEKLSARKITPQFLEVPTFKDGRKYGLAFAVSKFDFIQDLPNHEFRYRSNEVEEDLKEIITRRKDLNPTVKYDRGCGVFVWNIFFK